MACSGCEPRSRIPVLLGVLASALAARPLGAQQLMGTLRRSSDSTPVAGALVVVLDSAGRMVERTVSSEQGAFVMTVRSGRYTIRVLRVGQRPWQGGTVTVPGGGRASVSLYPDDQPVELPELRVAAEWSCGAAPPAAVTLLLEEASKALAITQATLDGQRLTFTVARWQRPESKYMLRDAAAGAFSR